MPYILRICWWITPLLTLSLQANADQHSTDTWCSYSTYKWNVKLKQAVDIQRIRRPYSSLSPTEIDEQTGCTVCEEDQVEINLPGIPRFTICNHFATNIRQVLLQAQQQGQVIDTVVGYRVGMTRGEVDAHGNRTQFSNHSFGIALDINSAYNGLYENCLSFGQQCRLRKGGQWHESHPKSLTPQSFLVKALKSVGMKWGGEIKGWQKDFMHFSPSGY